MKIFEISVFWWSIAPSYYGLMYVLGFVYGIWAIKRLLKYSQKEQESLLFFIFLGVILGGRIWYMIFYAYEDLWKDPLSILYIWEWGMSFHGGLIGVIISAYLFTKYNKKKFLKLMDALALIIPVGLFFGRIGNYINKELLWFSYEGFLAVQTSTWSYFPSPLIEAFLEGIIIFILLNYIHSQTWYQRPGRIAIPGILSSLFLIYYWVFRTFIEIFIRLPDAHIGYYFWFLTQWSILSMFMIVVGVVLYFYFQKKNVSI